MRSRFRTRWAVLLFIALGVLVAMILIIRDLGEDGSTEENGTQPALIR